MRGAENGGMKRRVIAIAFFAVFLCGCPSGGFFGRYVIVNSTDETLKDMTISSGPGLSKTWGETLAGQGWIHPGMVRKSLTVTWSDARGPHIETFDFEKQIGYRSHADVFLELKPNGVVAWRVVEPPQEGDRFATAGTMFILYIFYCILFALFVGVPVGLAGLVSWVTWHVACELGRNIRREMSGNKVFQFSIREILLLTTAIAVTLGWLVNVWAGMGR